MSNNHLRTIPGVGKSLAQDLMDLGYSSADELKLKDPELIYQNLIALRGSISTAAFCMSFDVPSISPVTKPTTKNY